MQLTFLKKEHMLKQEAVQQNVGNYSMKKFAQPTGYKPLLNLTELFFFQQFSGIYITLFFAVTFFKVSLLNLIFKIGFWKLALLT